MMLDGNPGLALVLAAAMAMLIAGAFGILSLLMPRRTSFPQSRGREGQGAVSVPEVKPRQARPASWVALSLEPVDLADGSPRKVVVDESLIEELFAEMFSIRSTIAQLRSELQAVSTATRVAQPGAAGGPAREDNLAPVGV